MANLHNVTFLKSRDFVERGYGSRYTVDKVGPFIVGRSWQVSSPIPQDVVLENRNVSTPHCFIVYHSWKFYLGDFGSNNGTSLNGYDVPNSLISKTFESSISEPQKGMLNSVIWHKEDSSKLLFSTEPKLGVGIGLDDKQREDYLKEFFYDRLREGKFRANLIEENKVLNLRHKDIIGIVHYKLKFSEGILERIGL